MLSMPMNAILNRSARLRIFVVVVVCLWALLEATGTQAESIECEELNGAQQMQCEGVMDCMAITDRDVRRACIAAVQRATPSGLQSMPTSANSTLPSGQSEMTVEVPESQTEAEEGPYPSAPPMAFIGEITEIYESVMNRRLLTINNQYLFESESAKRGRFKLGQNIELKRSSSLMGSRSWVLTGPVGSAVKALRIRCEHPDLGRNDRRRCAGMLNR